MTAASPEPAPPVTPGQAAYEAFLPNGPIDWEYADSDVRAMWEAAAQAAIEAGPNAPQRLAKGNEKLRGERDEARAAIGRMVNLPRGWDLKPGDFARLVAVGATPDTPAPALELAAAMAETRQLRAALEAVAAKWEAEAADADPGATPRPEASYASRKATVRTKRICVRQLRQALERGAPAAEPLPRRVPGAALADAPDRGAAEAGL